MIEYRRSGAPSIPSTSNTTAVSAEMNNILFQVVNNIEMKLRTITVANNMINCVCGSNCGTNPSNKITRGAISNEKSGSRIQFSALRRFNSTNNRLSNNTTLSMNTNGMTTVVRSS